MNQALFYVMGTRRDRQRQHRIGASGGRTKSGEGREEETEGPKKRKPFALSR